MTWTVLCDFDHTITTEDVTDTLLEKHALPEWLHIEQEWKDGLIGSRECMQQQVALLRATKEQVDQVADSIHVDIHFKNFAVACEKAHVSLFIVSDGLDYVIQRVLTRQGLEALPIIASHLAHKEEDRWELKTPFANANCTSNASTCKCTMARRIQTIAGADNILYIGDGRSDYCVSMEEADMILAKDSLLTYCQQHQLRHQAFKNFAEATALLAQLVEKDRQKLLPARSVEALYA